MLTKTFDYPFDESLIASEPASPRDSARLLVVRPDGALEHRRVADLPTILPTPAVVVANDTRVLAARLLGEKEGSGGKVEIFLLEQLRVHDDATETWKALGRASKKFRSGTAVRFTDASGEPGLVGSIEEVFGDGTLSIRLSTVAKSPLLEAIRRIGKVPLPPYIRRAADSEDRANYQTIFAKDDHEQAVAAPTAGLHFTRNLLDNLQQGRTLTSVTLHVGLGTFQPVTAADLDDHPMHEERYDISAEAAGHIERAKASHTPVVAIGTTVVRTLESAAKRSASPLPTGAGRTRLLIQPGHVFQVPDLLLTNFHLPQSTLLALVCAFAGTEKVLAAYTEAVRERYRFFSYGDAMLLWRAS